MKYSSSIIGLATTISLIHAVLSLPLEQEVFTASPSIKPLVDTQSLQSYVTEDKLRKRAEDLYSIAKASIPEYNHPTRVIGSAGHNGTIDYVLDFLDSHADYFDYYTQSFTVTSGRIRGHSFEVGGKTIKSGAVQLSPPTPDKQPVSAKLSYAGEGCYPSDFVNSEGTIALIKRGTCLYSDKSVNAGNAGAIAAVVFNVIDGDDLNSVTLGTPKQEHVPTFVITKADGETLVAEIENGQEISGTVSMNSEVYNTLTTNVVAETLLGDHENVVMLGSHSDSVAAGPGINDDGSGSISIIEVAEALTNFNVTNAVRFAWWAAEEEGLLGSDYYVSQLSLEENSKIRLFMDYDMMASPNYAYQVYDANNVDNPPGSFELKQLYTDFYESLGLNYTFVAFDGRSDYDAFIKNGIPGGGFMTGAEVHKTAQEVEMFGGVVDEQYDQCYHLLCDDLTNPAYDAWVVNTKAIANSVATYANTFEKFPTRSIDAISTMSRVPKFQYHGHFLVL